MKPGNLPGAGRFEPASRPDALLANSACLRPIEPGHDEWDDDCDGELTDEMLWEIGDLQDDDLEDDEESQPEYGDFWPAPDECDI